jgi:hypothetical protein
MGAPRDIVWQQALAIFTVLEGGSGNDTLRARDAVLRTPPDDRVNGQTGTDQCQIDVHDTALSCEVILP